MGARAPIFTQRCLLDVEGIGGEDHPSGIGIEVVIRQEGDAAEVEAVALHAARGANIENVTGKHFENVKIMAN